MSEVTQPHAPPSAVDAVTHPTLDPILDPVADRITTLVARSKSLDPATITSATTFDSLEIDSLDKINLTFEVEELYNISIPDDALNQLRTVGDVVDGVKSLLAAKAAAPAS